VLVKKNILVILCFIVSGSLVYSQTIWSQDVVAVTADDHHESSDECEEQFDDFFGSSDDEIHTMNRPKKEKWSRARILMVRLGVAAVLGVQGFYAWLNSTWAYITSWVTCEKRKA
jgi:hypothetical protein